MFVHEFMQIFFVQEMKMRFHFASFSEFFDTQNCVVKKFFMAKSERSLSPPLYQVHETKDGRLVSFFCGFFVF